MKIFGNFLLIVFSAMSISLMIIAFDGIEEIKNFHLFTLISIGTLLNVFYHSERRER